MFFVCDARLIYIYIYFVCADAENTSQCAEIEMWMRNKKSACPRHKCTRNSTIFSGVYWCYIYIYICDICCDVILLTLRRSQHRMGLICNRRRLQRRRRRRDVYLAKCSTALGFILRRTFIGIERVWCLCVQLLALAYLAVVCSHRVKKYYIHTFSLV